MKYLYLSGLHPESVSYSKYMIGIAGLSWWWMASQISWRGSLASSYTLFPGIPQGSVLSPPIFYIYTHPFDKVIASNGFFNHLFADETFSLSDMQVSACIPACSVIFKWMATHHLKLNFSRTELLFIPGDYSLSRDIVIIIDDFQIRLSENVRSFGVFLIVAGFFFSTSEKFDCSPPLKPLRFLFHWLFSHSWTTATFFCVFGQGSIVHH